MKLTEKQNTLVEQYRPSSLVNLCDSYKYWENYLTLPSKDVLNTLDCGKQDFYAQMQEDAENTIAAILYLISTFPLNERIEIPHKIFVASQNFWVTGKL